MASSDPLAPSGTYEPSGPDERRDLGERCDPQELAQVLEGIWRVEILLPGHSGDVVAPVTLQREIAELLQALRVAEVGDIACMCLGDVRLRFLNAHRRVVAEVGVHLPDEVKWQHWPGDARLRDPERLRSWLHRNGVDGPTDALQPPVP